VSKYLDLNKAKQEVDKAIKVGNLPIATILLDNAIATIEELRVGLESITYAESKGQAKRIAIQCLGRTKPRDQS
jgi:hypothetical protein